MFFLLFYDNIRDVHNRQGNPFLLLTFLSALTLAGILLLTIHADRQGSQADRPQTAQIAVEHDAAATLKVVQSAGKAAGIVEFAAEGSIVLLSVPSSWQRRDVRGAALTAVTADAPALGFTRWRLPANVTVSFRIDGSPSLTVRNASPTPLLVLGKRVDVVDGRIAEKSVLLQEGEVRMW